MRRKISILLIVLLVLSSSLPVLASNKIKDVPSDHWAYQSVKELVEKGYMSLYEDNKFNGDKKVSRYQLAKVINKILNNIKRGQVATDEEDVLTLKKLATEFRSELVKVMSESEELKVEVGSFNKEQKIIKEDIIYTNDKVNKLQKQVSQILVSLEEEAARIKELKNQIEILKQDNQTLSSRIERLEEDLNSRGSQAEIERLNNKFYWLTGGGAILLLLLMNN